MTVHRKADMCPSPDKAGGWIHSVAVRLCLDRQRTAKRRETLFARWFRRDDPPQHGGGRMDILGEAKLWTAIHELPARQREVVSYRYIDGLSTAETAEVLGISEGSVKASLFKALRTLRSKLDSPEMRELIDGPPEPSS